MVDGKKSLEVREALFARIQSEFDQRKRNIFEYENFFKSFEPGSFQHFLNNFQVHSDSPKGKLILEEADETFHFFFSNELNPKKFSFVVSRTKKETFSFKKRELTPEECLLEGSTYSLDLSLIFSLYKEVEGGALELINKEVAKLGSFPLLIGSEWCSKNYSGDFSSSFVYKGIRRNIANLSVIKRGMPLVTSPGNLVYYTRVGRRIRYLEFKENLGIWVSNTKVSFPLFTLLEYMGYSEKEIFEAFSAQGITQDQFMRSLNSSIIALDKLTPSEFLQNLFKGLKPLENFVSRFFDSVPERKQKLYFISLVCKKLLTEGKTDLDNLKNKEILSPSTIFISVFKETIVNSFLELEKVLMKKSLRNLKKKDEKTLTKIFLKIKFENNFNKLFMLGKIKERNSIVSFPLEPTNLLAYRSQIERTILDVDEKRIDEGMRKLRLSSYSKFCQLETPDGKSIGVKKNFAALSLVSTPFPQEETLKIIGKNINIHPTQQAGLKVFYVNGFFQGFISPSEIPSLIKNFSFVSSKNPSFNLGLIQDENMIEVDTSGGRVLSLYANVSSLKKPQPKFLNFNPSDPKSFQRYLRSMELVLFDNNTIKNFTVSPSLFKTVETCPNCGAALSQIYKDFFFSEEFGKITCKECGEVVNLEFSNSEYSMVSLYQTLGLAAISCSVFVDNSPSARSLYGILTSKQALMRGRQDYSQKMDRFFFRSLHNQRPLIIPKFLQASGQEEYAYTGQNCPIYYSTFRNTLYDGLVLSKAAIERGAFRSYTYEIYSENLLEFNFGNREIFGSKWESPTLQGGLPLPHSQIVSDGVLISKLSPISSQQGSFSDQLRSKQIETKVKTFNEIIDQILVFKNLSSEIGVKVKTRAYDIPLVGDKFSTRNGQKAILSHLVPERELNFNNQGIAPMVVYDVLSIGSRMTASSILEGKISRSLAEEGRVLYKVPFTQEGIRREGKESIMDALSGRVVEGNDFFFVNYYMRLHHLAKRKYFFRNEGKVQILTRQPTEGKSKKGGLRLGEMERDCFLAYGANYCLRDRFTSKAERIIVRYCPDCKRLLDKQAGRKIKTQRKCEVCKSSNCVFFEVSFGFKLLLSELFSLGIELRFEINDGIIHQIYYGTASAETIKRISRIKVYLGKSYNKEGFAVPGGVVDPHFGSIEFSQKCPVCLEYPESCTGHWGYLELTKPVCNYIFKNQIMSLLNRIDLNTGHAREDKSTSQKVTFNYETMAYFISSKTSQRILDDEEILELFRKIPLSDYSLLGLDKENPPENFVLLNLPIPPMNIRPSLITSAGDKANDDLTTFLEAIVSANLKLKNLVSFEFPQLPMDTYYTYLKYVIAVYMSNEGKIPISSNLSGKPMVSLSERLKGKQGRIRVTLSGKRTNNSARAVIAVDASLPIDTLGFPEVFSDMWLKEEITLANEGEFRDLVNRGLVEEIEYEGVRNLFVGGENLERVILDSRKERIFFKRPLRDGDTVLFNRQPSLHAHSILALKIKKVPGVVFKFHPALCFVFNADFDGDEMNVFIPQSEQAKVEAQLLMSPRHNLFSHKSGGAVFTPVLDVILNLHRSSSQGETYSPNQIFTLTRNLSLQREVILDEEGKASLGEIFSSLLPSDFNFRSSDNSFEINSGRYCRGVFTQQIIGIGGELVRALAEQFPDEFLDSIHNIFTLSSNLEQIYSVGINGNITKIPISFDSISEIEPHIRGYLELFSSSAKGTLFNVKQIFQRVGAVHLRQGSSMDIVEFPISISPEGRRYESIGKDFSNINSGFMRGFTPEQYFIQTIAGMEGLIDRSVRTASTGYMQRKLVYCLEDLCASKQGVILGGKNRTELIQLNYGEGGVSPTSPLIVSKTCKDLAEVLVPGENTFSYASLLEEFPLIQNVLFNFFEEGGNNYTPESVKEYLGKISSEIESEFIDQGTLVGIITAQSFGEPVSQMTMKTFQQASGGSLISIDFKVVSSLLEPPKNLSLGKSSFQLLDKSKEAAINFFKRIRPLTLKDCIDSMEVEGETLSIFFKPGMEEIISSFVAKNKGKLEGGKALFDSSLSSKIQSSLNKKIRRIKSIDELFLKEEGGYSLESKGSNLKFFMEMPEIDFSLCDTTSLRDVYNCFGIEGAWSALIHYLERGFAEQGLKIGYNHLLLIADSLCYKEELSSILRTGRIQDHNPLTQSIFERTFQIFVKSAVEGLQQFVTGPMEHFILGQVGNFGSSSNTLVVKKKKEI